VLAVWRVESCGSEGVHGCWDGSGAAECSDITARTMHRWFGARRISGARICSTSGMEFEAGRAVQIAGTLVRAAHCDMNAYALEVRKGADIVLTRRGC